MSSFDRSAFTFKSALDESVLERDCESIYVSFSSTVVERIFLRHENGRVKLGKNDQSSLFFQDATFRLIVSGRNKDMVAFQSTNADNAYIAVDNTTNTALVLIQPNNTEHNIDVFDKKFLFKLDVSS